MYSVTGTSVVTVLALVLVFSSSLLICCVCIRIAGRRRYRPASRDELERAFFPPPAEVPQRQRPERQSSSSSSSFISQQQLLAESIGRKLQQPRRQLLKAAFRPADSVATVDYRCYDNTAFWGREGGGGSSSRAATTDDPLPPLSYCDQVNSGYAGPGIDPGYYLGAAPQQPSMPHPRMRTDHALIRSRETEL